MKKKKLYLHIGTEKTGTTSIQHALGTNQTEILKYGVLYPKSTMDEYYNHIKLPVYSLDDDKIHEVSMLCGVNNKDQLYDFRRKLACDLKSELDNFTGDTVVMSNEHCSSRLVNVDEIVRLKDFLSDFFEDIKIVVYIREQVSMLTSSYSTSVKYGATYPMMNAVEFSSLKNFYDYNSILEKWENVFGIENIIIKIFDKTELRNSNAVDDFAWIINHELKLKHCVQLNSSLNLKQLEFLRRMNRYFPYMIDGKVNKYRNDLVNTVIDYKASSPKIKDLVTQEYLDVYKESNEILKKRYFPNKKNLFKPFELSDNIIEDQMNCLSVNDCMEFLTHLYKTVVGRNTELKNSLDVMKKELLDNVNEYEVEIRFNIKKGIHLADVYRDIALQIAKYGELEDAIKYMRLALSYRPNGSFIKQKLNEFIQISESGE